MKMHEVISKLRQELWVNDKMDEQARLFMTAVIKAKTPVFNTWDIELNSLLDQSKSGSLADKGYFRALALIHQNDCCKTDHSWIQKELNSIYLNRVYNGDNSNNPINLWDGKIQINLIPKDMLLLLSVAGANYEMTFTMEDIYDSDFE